MFRADGFGEAAPTPSLWNSLYILLSETVWAQGVRGEPKLFTPQKRYLPAAFFAFLPLFFYLDVVISTLVGDPACPDATLNGDPCAPLLATLNWGILTAGVAPNTSLPLLAWAFHQPASVEMWLWLTAVCGLMSWVEDRQGSFLTEGVLAVACLCGGWTTWWMAPTGTFLYGAAPLFYALIGSCIGELLLNPFSSFPSLRWIAVGLCTLSIGLVAIARPWLAVASFWAWVSGILFSLAVFTIYENERTGWVRGRLFWVRPAAFGVLLSWIIGILISFGLTPS